MPLRCARSCSQPDRIVRVAARLLGVIDYGATVTMIVDWHRARFPEAAMEHVCLKAMEELGEVAQAVNGVSGRNAPGRRGDVAEECADVVVCLIVLLGRWFPEADLLGEVARKAAILVDPNSGHRSAALRPPAWPTG